MCLDSKDANIFILGQSTWFRCPAAVPRGERDAEAAGLHAGQPRGVDLAPALQALDTAGPARPEQPHGPVHGDVLQRAV